MRAQLAILAALLSSVSALQIRVREVPKGQRDLCAASTGGFKPLSDTYFAAISKRALSEKEACLASNVTTDITKTADALQASLASYPRNARAWLEIEFLSLTSAGLNPHGGDSIKVFFDSGTHRVAGTIEDLGAGSYKLHAVFPESGSYKLAMQLTGSCFGRPLPSPKSVQVLPDHRMDLASSSWSMPSQEILVEHGVAEGGSQECPLNQRGLTLAGQGYWLVHQEKITDVRNLSESSAIEWHPFCCSISMMNLISDNTQPEGDCAHEPDMHCYDNTLQVVGDSTLPDRTLEIGNPYEGRPTAKKLKWHKDRQERLWARYLKHNASAMHRGSVTVLNAALHLLGNRTAEDALVKQTEMMCDVAVKSNGTGILWLFPTYVQSSVDPNLPGGRVTQDEVLALNEQHRKLFSKSAKLSDICEKEDLTGRVEHADLSGLGAAIPDFYTDDVHTNKVVHFGSLKKLVRFYIRAAKAMQV